MVNEIRIPSSSSSVVYCKLSRLNVNCERMLTNVDRLDGNSFFNVCCLRAFDDLVLQEFGLNEGVHKGGTPSTRRT